MHLACFYRRCEQSLNGVSLCPNRTHKRLYGNAETLSNLIWPVIWPACCAVFRQTQYFPGQSTRSRWCADSVFACIQNTVQGISKDWWLVPFIRIGDMDPSDWRVQWEGSISSAINSLMPAISVADLNDGNCYFDELPQLFDRNLAPGNIHASLVRVGAATRGFGRK